jgi:hypothetical protein|tara:strand:- start:5643 stop:6137 length:495 start_codon:yes stop_codon:yes gene_type:complete
MIVEDIKQQAGKKNRSGAWYINALTQSLSQIQNPDISTSDTNGIIEGDLFFFSYSPSFPERYQFWDTQPLAVALKFYRDGFLGCNLHYVNPSYRDSVAISLLNSGGGAAVPKNTLHKYLYSGVGSLLKVPKNEDWGEISKLPTEQFIDRNGMKYPKYRAFNWKK